MPLIPTLWLSLLVAVLPVLAVGWFAFYLTIKGGA
jgi:hypothetical protein